jgi:cytolysin-activating lysine-acyltransferase
MNEVQGMANGHSGTVGGIAHRGAEVPMNDKKEDSPAAVPGTLTISEALGQVVYLLGQSKMHRELKIKDLEWSFLPAITHEQFRIFRFGPLPGGGDLELPSNSVRPITREGIEQMPLGVAIWAKLSAEAEAKLEKGEHLTLAEWKSGDRVWLVELITPWATATNKLAEAMLTDLIRGPFRDTAFNLHRTDPKTGKRDKVHMKAHLGQMGGRQ